jgi:electron transfer flavoprotein alpha subunit
MSILVYTESENNEFKKSALEALSYAKALGNKMDENVTCVSINSTDFNELKKHGADKIIDIQNPSLEKFISKSYAEAIHQIVKNEEIKIIILSSSTNSKYLGAYLSGKLESAFVSNVVELPSKLNPFLVKRTCYTNKAFSTTEIKGEIKIISVSSNSFGIIENSREPDIKQTNIKIGSSNLKIKKIDKQTGTVTIADADIVVSGGRGLKGPENWHLIEKLADVLGAATACSKPVSDLGWRPHSEHVGQTGKPVASNLYIAIGISGAIQHLAGINASKVKVVINNDPEAPFFKAADYGIVGDAFEVVPKLIEKLENRQ